MYHLWAPEYGNQQHWFTISDFLRRGSCHFFYLATVANIAPRHLHLVRDFMTSYLVQWWRVRGQMAAVRKRTFRMPFDGTSVTLSASHSDAHIVICPGSSPQPQRVVVDWTSPNVHTRQSVWQTDTCQSDESGDRETGTMSGGHQVTPVWVHCGHKS